MGFKPDIESSDEWGWGGIRLEGREVGGPRAAAKAVIGGWKSGCGANAGGYTTFEAIKSSWNRTYRSPEAGEGGKIAEKLRESAGLNPPPAASASPQLAPTPACSHGLHLSPLHVSIGLCFLHARCTTLSGWGPRLAPYLGWGGGAGPPRWTPPSKKAPPPEGGIRREGTSEPVPAASGCPPSLPIHPSPLPPPHACLDITGPTSDSKPGVGQGTPAVFRF